MPHGKHLPARSPQLLANTFVAGLVGSEFRPPKYDMGLWRCCPAAPLMPVPKASMNEDYLPQSCKYQVGLSGQILSVKPIPPTHRKDEMSDRHLWASVLAPDRGHEAASVLASKSIHAQNPSRRGTLHAHVSALPVKGCEYAAVCVFRLASESRSNTALAGCASSLDKAREGAVSIRCVLLAVRSHCPTCSSSTLRNPNHAGLCRTPPYRMHSV